MIVLVGFFALARFFTALAGMDIGTAFGGMGSSREMTIAALAEPAMLMAVFTLSMTAGHDQPVGGHRATSCEAGLVLRPSFLFALLALAMVAVAETGRIPVDNPATHLELTMMHEAMILEYSGRHLALIEWAAQIKLMIYAVLIVNIFLPWGIATGVHAPRRWRIGRRRHGGQADAARGRAGRVGDGARQDAPVSRAAVPRVCLPAVRCSAC